MTMLGTATWPRIWGKRLAGSRLRWVGRGAMLAFTLSACDSSPVDLQPREPRKLAEVLLVFDLDAKVVHTTVIPVAGGPFQSVGDVPAPRFDDEPIGTLLAASDTVCVPCRDGVLGLHDIGVTLTNKGLFNLDSLRVAGHISSGISEILRQTKPPVTLAPGSSFQQGFRVRVTTPKFTFRFYIFGDP